MKDILVRKILKSGSILFLGLLGGDRKQISLKFAQNSNKTLEGSLFLAKCGISIAIFSLGLMFFIGNIIFFLLGSLGFSEIGFKLLWLFVLVPSFFVLISALKSSILDSKKKSSSYNTQKYWLNLCDLDILISFLISVMIAIFLKY